MDRVDECGGVRLRNGGTEGALGNAAREIVSGIADSIPRVEIDVVTGRVHDRGGEFVGG